MSDPLLKRLFSVLWIIGFGMVGVSLGFMGSGLSDLNEYQSSECPEILSANLSEAPFVFKDPRPYGFSGPDYAPWLAEERAMVEEERREQKREHRRMQREALDREIDCLESKSEAYSPFNEWSKTLVLGFVALLAAYVLSGRPSSIQEITSLIFTGEKMGESNSLGRDGQNDFMSLPVLDRMERFHKVLNLSVAEYVLNRLSEIPEYKDFSETDLMRIASSITNLMFGYSSNEIDEPHISHLKAVELANQLIDGNKLLLEVLIQSRRAIGVVEFGKSGKPDLLEGYAAQLLNKYGKNYPSAPNPTTYPKLVDSFIQSLPSNAKLSAIALKQEMLPADNGRKSFMSYFEFNRIVAGALFLAILPMPSEYYWALRVAIFGISIYCYFDKKEDYKDLAKLGFVLMAVVFNPIWPVYLDKVTWVLIDIASGSLFLWLNSWKSRRWAK